MSHKRNPAMATSVIAAWRRAQGQSAVLLGAMPQEHERAVGAWQANPRRSPSCAGPSEGLSR